jgi:hypothetical protein
MHAYVYVDVDVKCVNVHRDVYVHTRARVYVYVSLCVCVPLLAPTCVYICVCVSRCQGRPDAKCTLTLSPCVCVCVCACEQTGYTRDACILFARERPYREYPRVSASHPCLLRGPCACACVCVCPYAGDGRRRQEWVERTLRSLGMVVVQAVSLPTVYGPDKLLGQLDVCRDKLARGKASPAHSPGGAHTATCMHRDTVTYTPNPTHMLGAWFFPLCACASVGV